MEKSFKELYMESSKHSNYQILPSNLKDLMKDEDLMVQSRYEKERLKYITENVNLKGKTVLDIGGNTGFFTFETHNAGASKIDYYEGNQTHAEFVKKGIEVLELKDKIAVFPQYYLFNQKEKIYDVAYLLNVVHHSGDDFGDSISIEKAKSDILACINVMAEITKVLVFQMGFNWCGNRNKCLFEQGTKAEMEEFIQKGTVENWEIIKIGVAVKKDCQIKYEDVNLKNNQREDELGEFLNRPIFIMKSKII